MSSIFIILNVIAGGVILWYLSATIPTSGVKTVEGRATINVIDSRIVIYDEQDVSVFTFHPTLPVQQYMLGLAYEKTTAPPARIRVTYQPTLIGSVNHFIEIVTPGSIGQSK